jgi:hypothetical protein
VSGLQLGAISSPESGVTNLVPRPIRHWG